MAGGCQLWPRSRRSTGDPLPKLLDSRQRPRIGWILQEPGLVLAQGLGVAPHGLVNIAKSEMGPAVRLIQAEGSLKVALRLLQITPVKIDLAEKVVSKHVRLVADGSAKLIFGLTHSLFLKEKPAKLIENAVVERRQRECHPKLGLGRARHSHEPVRRAQIAMCI